MIDIEHLNKIAEAYNNNKRIEIRVGVTCTWGLSINPEDCTIRVMGNPLLSRIKKEPTVTRTPLNVESFPMPSCVKFPEENNLVHSVARKGEGGIGLTTSDGRIISYTYDDLERIGVKVSVDGKDWKNCWTEHFVE